MERMKFCIRTKLGNAASSRRVVQRCGHVSLSPSLSLSLSYEANPNPFTKHQLTNPAYYTFKCVLVHITATMLHVCLHLVLQSLIY